jgi:DNA-binding MarR family transcriptional regulator
MPEESGVQLEAFHRHYIRAMFGLDLVRLGNWERYGLSLPQLRILFRLRRQPGATTRDLSRALGVTMPTTSALVQKLVERGLVARGHDQSDRRLIPLVLTESGLELAGLARASSLAFTERVAQALGHELPSVTAALERLAGVVEAIVAEGEIGGEVVGAGARGG